ncbi:hypothetical protein ABW20_dc0101788 [Dactylellina cionopaga]|nr:hypothetical protein ABW20_dc0101788 [Dactylellina cionopaga]
MDPEAPVPPVKFPPPLKLTASPPPGPAPIVHDFAYAPTSQPPDLWPPPSNPNSYDAPTRSSRYVPRGDTDGWLKPEERGNNKKDIDGNSYINRAGQKYKIIPPYAVMAAKTDEIIFEQPKPIKDVAFWNNLMEEEEKRAEVRAMQKGCLFHRILCWCCCDGCQRWI